MWCNCNLVDRDAEARARGKIDWAISGRKARSASMKRNEEKINSRKWVEISKAPSYTKCVIEFGDWLHGVIFSSFFCSGTGHDELWVIAIFCHNIITMTAVATSTTATTTWWQPIQSENKHIIAKNICDLVLYTLKALARKQFWAEQTFHFFLL